LTDKIRSDNRKEELPRVAFFCMEYGLANELPIYAGGLGILAGDFLKTARDVNYPVIGIGILWRQDYTTQLINEEGRPYDLYPSYDYEYLEETGITIELNIQNEKVPCKVRKTNQYNNAPLYLLDTNFPDSNHGWITEKLYCTDPRTRIAQEMILGIGGIKIIKALDLDIDIYHFNEGHAVFAGLELIRERMKEDGKSFEEAFNEINKKITFTTHTPVGAGNEVHDFGLLDEMGVFEDLEHKDIENLGGNPFSMTAAGLRLANVTNGVSELHGQTVREIWRDLDNMSPVISITNGVHTKTWQNNEIRRAFEKGEDLWEPHQNLKNELIKFVEKKTGSRLKMDSIIIGFARRAAPYKRSELIFQDTEKIDPLLKEGKMQLIFSGKAHPSDEKGKDIVQNLVKMERKYGDNVVFIENYDMEIARYMIQGCDVWLNNPRRPLEASGTSGMKAALNGVLNLSVIDGWLAEGPIHGVSAWLIDEILHPQVDKKNQDEYDLKALYKALYEEVIPTYYDRRNEWQDMMRASIDMATWKFSTQRMIKEYYDRMYTVDLNTQKEEAPVV